MKVPKIIIYALIFFVILYLFNRTLAKKVLSFGKEKTQVGLEEIKQMILENNAMNRQTRQRAFSNQVDFEDQLEADAQEYQKTFY